MNRIRYQYDNHLGNACLELDFEGDIISYEEYHPFGTTSYRSGRSETEVSMKRYKYNGKERDEETGFYAYGMRYYAAWICRFVSVDPLQFKYQYYTPFQYAGNKPISFIDLDGAEEFAIRHDIEDGIVQIWLLNINNAWKVTQIENGQKVEDGKIVSKTEKDWGFKEIQEKLGGVHKESDNRLYNKNNEAFPPYPKNDKGVPTLQWSVHTYASKLTPNEYDNVPNDTTIIEEIRGAGSEIPSITKYEYDIPVSSTDAVVTLFYNSVGNEINIFTVKSIESGVELFKGNDTGSFMFNVPTGEKIEVSVTGNQNKRTGKGSTTDEYNFTLTIQTYRSELRKEMKE